MTRTYRISSICAYCNKMNENVLYEPLEENCIYYCRHCGKTNFITFEWKSKRLEDVVREDVLDCILMESIFDVSREELERLCDSIIKRIERCRSLVI